MQRKLFLLSAGLIICACLHGQQTPAKPVSYPFFSTLVLNPAITGTINYTSVNLISRMNSAPGAQMAALNSRLLKPGSSALSNLGLGGYLFQDRLPGARDFGVGISAAYHFPLGTKNSSGLAFGLAAKGLYHLVTDAGETVGTPATNFIPNTDLGLYYYGSYGFAGISSINMLGLLSDSLAANEYAVPSEHLFYGGLKFVLSRRNGVILEPALVVSLNDSILYNPWSSTVVPYLKLHVQNASIGTRFKSLDNLAFFLQYHFPRFYAGLFVEYPLNEMLIRSDQVNVELSFGLNLGKNRQSATLLKIPEPLFDSGTELAEKPAGKTEVKKEDPAITPPAVTEPDEKVEVKLVISEEAVVQEDATEPKVVQEEKKVVEEESEVVIFRVQISSTSKMSTKKSVLIDGKSYEIYEYFYVSAYRQCIGNFRDLDAANALSRRCRADRYKHAFVAAFINDERVTDPAVFKR